MLILIKYKRIWCNLVFLCFGGNILSDEMYDLQ
jgi:hypothetical protein